MEELYFYYSKGKLIALTFACFLISAVCAAVSYSVFLDGDGLIGSIVLLGALLLLFVGVLYIKKVVNPNPYVIMTDQELTLYVTNQEAVHISWEDIVGVLPYEIHRNKFLGLELANEEKYEEQMPNKVKRMSRLNMKMGYPMYNIILNQVKDPNGLIEALDKRIEVKERFEEEG
ncbi:STM3941 family protein [Pontibacillus salipaludis]|nr:STM3941 family protein [Pontibacillus salipaludis]